MAIEVKGMRLRSRKSSGFTLIELLVVIAIIAILASILFPVFAKARETGRRAACLGNMKQLGTGIRMYCEDNGGRMYPGNYPYGSATVVQVVTALSKYIPAQAVVGSKIGKVWQCPSDKTFGFAGADPSVAWPQEMSYFYSGVVNPWWPPLPAGVDATKIGRNLDYDSGDPVFKGQFGCILSDNRVAVDWTNGGATFDGHGSTTWLPNDNYVKNLPVIRLMPDLHARICQNWQRYIFRKSDGKSYGNSTAEMATIHADLKSYEYNVP
jgi:prepilin-type N-terminal cleavage/methylation domain-containing protein